MTKSAQMTTTVSTKGQVIIPKTVRQNRRWGAGARLVVEETADGVLLKSAPYFPPTNLDDVAGMLEYDGPPISIEDMDAAIETEARRRARD